MEDVTAVLINITFGENGQQVVNVTATPQDGVTKDPTIRVIREILIKTLWAYDREEPTFPLIVEKGFIKENQNFNLPPLYFLDAILDALNPKASGAAAAALIAEAAPEAKAAPKAKKPPKKPKC